LFFSSASARVDAPARVDAAAAATAAPRVAVCLHIDIFPKFRLENADAEPKQAAKSRKVCAQIVNERSTSRR
jgi:hypothetical protein